MSDYAAFLASKRREWSGAGISSFVLPPSLYPFQSALTSWALRKGRAAIFADTGTGKTRMQLAWAANIPGRVLILAPLCVGQQTIAEGSAIGVAVGPCGSGASIEITNYERLHHVSVSEYAGIVLDESSILKAYDGKTRTRLIRAFADTPYRLCCTATPAPNDIAELANHCLPYHACIRTRDGVREIGDIVRGRESVEVLSLDDERTVWARVTNWSARPNPEGLWRIQWGRGGRGASLLSTPNHRILTRVGWRPVEEVKVGDEVAVATPAFSREQEEIIFGTLLGDSWLRTLSGWPSLISAHAEPQWAYLQWMADTLDAKMFDTAPPKRVACIRGKDVRSKPQRRLRTPQLPALWPIWCLAYRDGKKCVTRAWLERVGILGLAVWAMDDGTMRVIRYPREARICGCKRGPHRNTCSIRGTTEQAIGRHFVFCTNGFTDDDCSVIVAWLSDRFGLRGAVDAANRIVLTRESTLRLRELIAEYVKLGDNGKKWLSPSVVHGQADGAIWLPVVCSQREPSTSKIGRVYDVEVEATHNFVMASGLVIHNCEFLGIMTRAEMLATWFVHDEDGWRLKGHAHEAFYRWLVSWGIFLRRPSDLGFDDTGYVLPGLDIQEHIVETNEPITGEYLFPSMGLGGIGGRTKARRHSLKPRADRVVELVEQSPGSWIIWCGLNDEQEMIAASLDGDCVSVAGNDDEDTKRERLTAFLEGRARVLVTKARIAGFGLNMQHCHQMAFLGLGDSYETYYQSIRRCYRFGQTQLVQVHIVVSEAETGIVRNVQRKEVEARQMAEELLDAVRAMEREEVGVTERQTETSETQTAHGEAWTLYRGDSVALLPTLPEASVDFSIYSPPFIALYTYTNSERDIGNCGSREEFLRHYAYVVREVLRLTKPGRLSAVHIAQTTTTKATDGLIGLRDLRGAVIDLHIREGWIYHGEVCIDKDPQAQAIRTHSKALLFVQLRKDASWLRPALADYILVFKKPGDNAEPIHPDITNEDWIEWARPIWYNIRESDTLNVREARSDDDDRHICPLQLGTIERCVRLWSNPGDLVLSPFAGIGSEGYESLRHGRRFVGIELKPEYAEAACKNLARMESTLNAQAVLPL